MDFLESLYSIDNFGIYLFIIIGVLVVLFLLVLFFGKKDQKKRKDLEEKLEQTKAMSQDAFKEVTEPVAVEPAASETLNSEPEAVMPVAPVEPVAPLETTDNQMPTTNAVLNSEIITPEAKPEVKEEPKKEFDFDALADAISKELADLEKSTPAPVKEEAVMEPKEVTPVHFEARPREMVSEPVVTKEEVVEEKPRVVTPQVFSSVYVNREKEEVKPEVEEVKKAPIDLPKMVDLPKRVDSVSKPVLEDKKEDDIIFP